MHVIAKCTLNVITCHVGTNDYSLNIQYSNYLSRTVCGMHTIKMSSLLTCNSRPTVINIKLQGVIIATLKHHLW